jgi:hypothetical protein
MDWQIPLVISAAVFAAFIIFKWRPAMTSGARATAADLEEAKRRLEAATDDETRATALADAGDACARLGRVNGATGFYLRALRAGPNSVPIVRRAATALARRPAVLENLMWRHLAVQPWVGERRASALAALHVLSDVYGRRHRHHARKQAIDHALAALGDQSPGSGS